MNWIELSQDFFIPGISILEKIIRPILIYLFLLVGLRLAGRSELSQLNAFDFVVLLILSNTVQNAIIGNDTSFTGGVIGAIALLGFNKLLEWYFFTHPRISKRAEGRTIYLVKDGELNKPELRRQLIKTHELEIVFRKQGMDNLGEVDECILEPTGNFMVKAKKDKTMEVKMQAHLIKLEQIEVQLEQLALQQQKLIGIVEALTK